MAHFITKLPSLSKLSQPETRKKVIRYVLLADVAILAGLDLEFLWLRKSENARKLYSEKFPRTLNAYYWVEDKISFGKGTGKDMKEADFQKWNDKN